MPYLEYVFCDQCGNHANLDIDPVATIEAYRAEGRENVALVQQTLVWDYLMYSCGICGNTYKYTYRDVERKVRTYFSSLSEEFKEYFDTVIEQASEKEDPLPTEPTQPQEKFAERRSRVSERVRDRYTAKK
jgi:transcription elongation factor Elf1